VPRAVGGASLLRGAETAQRTVVARVDSVDSVDAHGYRALLAVERDLADATGGGAPETLTIGWEELAQGRPPRFAAGERVLVALEPLPGYSLWRKRFPDGKALAVAMQGLAFLRDPDPGTIDALARYLHVAPAERSEAPGVEAMARLVADAVDSVALGCAQRLTDVAGLATKLREPAAASLGAAITSPTRSEALRRTLLGLAGDRRLDALRPFVLQVTATGPPLAGPAWTALASIDGGLPADTVKRLIGDADPGVRAVAVRHAADTPEQARAILAIRRDPAPEVRAAAAEAMIATKDPTALAAGYDALFDRVMSVRAAAGRALGALESDTVPHLRELALAHSMPDAEGPLGALAFGGPEGQAALIELSLTHSDEKARGFAKMLLGQDPRKP
jgi:HEAT repeat protein